MLPMRKPISSLIALVIAFVSLGLAPAYALDQRVIDVVSVTWNGAVPLRGDVTTVANVIDTEVNDCLLYTSPSPRDRQKSRMPSSA